MPVCAGAQLKQLVHQSWDSKDLLAKLPVRWASPWLLQNSLKPDMGRQTQDTWCFRARCGCNTPDCPGSLTSPLCGL